MHCNIPTLVLVLLLSAPLTVMADVCDDINDIANGWNYMADALHEADLSQLTEADYAEIDSGIDMAYGATEEFADILEMAEDNPEVVELGEDLNEALVMLWENEDGSINDIVDSMDGIVDALDNITDYCDQQ